MQKINSACQCMDEIPLFKWTWLLYAHRSALKAQLKKGNPPCCHKLRSATYNRELLHLASVWGSYLIAQHWRQDRVFPRPFGWRTLKKKIFCVYVASIFLIIFVNSGYLIRLKMASFSGFACRVTSCFQPVEKSFRCFCVEVTQRKCSVDGLNGFTVLHLG